MNADSMAGLRRVAGRQTVRLTHYGRKTGKPYEVTIWFVVSGEKVYLSTANVGRQWVRNVQQTPRVQLKIAGEVFEGQARFLSDPADRKRVMRLVGKKYWPFLPLFAIWRLLQALGLARDATGAFEVSLA